MSEDHTPDWRTQGVRVVPGDQLDTNTPQTPGMLRAAAINQDMVGAQKIWAGTVAIEPKAKTGTHHHGALESVIYIVSGQARMRWGEQLEFIAEAGPGDFIFVPPFVPHQEINASDEEPLFDVYGAEEAFVTGTFGGLTPVTAVDGRAIGSYGSMTKKLQAHYDEAVHRAVDDARPSR